MSRTEADIQWDIDSCQSEIKRLEQNKLSFQNKARSMFGSKWEWELSAFPGYTDVLSDISKNESKISSLKREIYAIQENEKNELINAMKQPPKQVKPIPAGATAESLTERGFLFLEDSKWENATEYFNYALDINPKHAHAYIGLLCAEMKYESESVLPRLFGKTKPFSLLDYDNYKKALRFADFNYRAKLEGYEKSIQENEKREQARKIEQAYNNLIEEKSNAKTKKYSSAQLRNLSKRFRDIADYKNSYELADECNRMAQVEQEYENERRRKDEEEKTRKKSNAREMKNNVEERQRNAEKHKRNNAEKNEKEKKKLYVKLKKLKTQSERKQKNYSASV